ncbi:uncharacterized protein O3C94_017456 [Discoglossus pictus]
MAGVVTYADLKFVKTPQKDSPNAGFSQNQPEDYEMTYANLTTLLEPDKPSKISTVEETVSSPGFGHHCWNPKLTIILLVSCLVLLVLSIGMTVKYVQVTGELHQMSLAKSNLSRTLSLHIHDTEYTVTQKDMKLNELQEKLDQVSRDLQNQINNLLRYNESFQESKLKLAELQTQYRDISEEKVEKEEKLKEYEDNLRQSEQNFNACQYSGYCLPGWTLMAGKCLFFSHSKNLWYEGKKQCEDKDSRLLVLKEDEEILKNFIKNKNTEFWVGLRKDWPWKWLDGSPWSGPGMSESYGVIRNGIVQGESWNNYHWICEKSPVQIKFSKSAEFVFPNKDYHCHKWE